MRDSGWTSLRLSSTLKRLVCLGWQRTWEGALSGSKHESGFDWDPSLRSEVLRWLDYPSEPVGPFALFFSQFPHGIS